MKRDSRLSGVLHCLLHMAERGTPVTSEWLARAMHTNPVVIRRLLSALVKARLVKAQKGAAGGFALASAAENVSLLDVYRAVEPRPNRGLRTFAPNHRCPVGAKIEHILESVFFKAQAGMEAELAREIIAGIEREVRAVCPSRR